MSGPERVIVGAVDSKDKVAGSKQAACYRCAGLMWLAPSGQHMVASGYAPLCLTCALATLQPTDTIAIAPGALGELAGWRGRN